jgi:hypothetical protein
MRARHGARTRRARQSAIQGAPGRKTEEQSKKCKANEGDVSKLKRNKTKSKPSTRSRRGFGETVVVLESDEDKFEEENE